MPTLKSPTFTEQLRVLRKRNPRLRWISPAAIPPPANKALSSLLAVNMEGMLRGLVSKDIYADGDILREELFSILQEESPFFKKVSKFSVTATTTELWFSVGGKYLEFLYDTLDAASLGLAGSVIRVILLRYLFFKIQATYGVIYPIEPRQLFIPGRYHSRLPFGGGLFVVLRLYNKHRLYMPLEKTNIGGKISNSAVFIRALKHTESMLHWYLTDMKKHDLLQCAGISTERDFDGTLKFVLSGCYSPKRYSSRALKKHLQRYLNQQLLNGVHCSIFVLLGVTSQFTLEVRENLTS